MKTLTRIKDIIYDDKLKAALIENVSSVQAETVDVDGIFDYIGQKPNTVMSGKGNVDR